MALKRKQYVVDKKFQLGTTFTVIGVIFLIVAVIIGLIAFNAVQNNRKLDRIIDVGDNIEAVYHQKAVKVPVLLKMLDKYHVKVIDDDGTVMTAESQMIETRCITADHITNQTDMKLMVKRNTWILASVVGLVIIQGIVLFFVLILKTHRIAGPIYVMSMYMRQIVDGSVPDSLRPLRKHDEFKEFYSLFGRMVETIRSSKKSSASKAVKKAVKKSVKRR